MRFDVLTTTVFVAVAAVCLARPQAEDIQPTKDHPLFAVNLHEFGYEKLGGQNHLRRFVEFPDSSHLAFAWLTLDDPTEEIGPLTPRPAHLHVLILDSKNGQKQGLRDWPTPSTRVRFMTGRAGGLLTCTGKVLRLLSPTLEIEREQNLANYHGCLDVFGRPGWGMSPSRRSLLLSFP